MEIEYDPKRPFKFPEEAVTYQITGCPSCGDETTEIKAENFCCHVEVCEKCMYLSLQCDDAQSDTEYHRIDKEQLKSILKHKY